MKRFLVALAAAVAVIGCARPEENLTAPAELASLSASARNNYRIYQVNPRLFSTGSQLKAVEKRLDEIAALGTDVLYLMPIYTEGKEKSVGSPYCIRDYKGVKSECGTLQDVKSLVNAAHDRGMLVMFDWVANHTAWDNAWVTEHPEWYEKDKDGNIVYPTKDGAWTDVAQLDYSSAALQDAMTDAMKYWITEADIDGYRCDYAHGVADAFWVKAIAELKALKPGFLMLAESDYEKMFTDGFDIIYDRSLKASARKLFAGGEASDFASAYKRTQANTPQGKTKLYFVTNHDDASEKSPVTEFGGKDAAFAAFSLLAALNGSPMLYSSQETGYGSPVNFFRTLKVDWNADSGLTSRYKEVLSAIEDADRDGECHLLLAESVLFVQYGSGLLVGINTGGSAVKVLLPDGAPKRSASFSACEVKVWK